MGTILFLRMLVYNRGARQRRKVVDLWAGVPGSGILSGERIFGGRGSRNCAWA
jgi:hypothetical protein